MLLFPDQVPGFHGSCCLHFCICYNTNIILDSYFHLRGYLENWINVLSLYKSFFLHLSMTWCDREWRIWILAHYELGLTICQLCDLGSHVNYHVVVVQSLSCVQLFATPWTAELQASLSVSWSLPKLTSIDLVMPSNHLILCCPLLLLPSIFSRIRLLSSESTLRIRWPKYWSFSNQHQSFQQIFMVNFL